MAKPQAGLSNTPPPALPGRWMGERGLRVESGAATLARFQQLISRNFAEIEDVIPADGSLLLIFKPEAAPSDDLRRMFAQAAPERPGGDGVLHVLPMVPGGEAGPDLARCAAYAGLSEAEFLRQFLAIEFTVAFVGFQPGFPYLAGLPEPWAIPRRSTPRVRVPAGSVALGGGYAGVYPAAGPGGWQLVGHTEARLFDPARAEPALLAAGDRVRFEVRR